MNRRHFLFSAALATAGLSAFGARPIRILLRSSWQTVNIGDIAHTPGMLALIEKHLPGAEIRLWPNSLSTEVHDLLVKQSPTLKFVTLAETQKAAIQECDFCLHGSGPGLVGADVMKRWRETGKPYGFGGVTLNDQEISTHRDLIKDAKFVYCRDTHSLDALRSSSIKGPLMEFGPDATFFLESRDDAKAESFLKDHALVPTKFACFIPRLRWTPYWKERTNYPPEEQLRREVENEKYAESDHAKMREAIITWVRKTKNPALLCPEMTYEVELLRPLLYDPLPDDVKKMVVVRPNYWLTAEAASTYARAAVVVSLEMHSPIIAIANRTPAIHLRQPTDTRKGQMWRDIGLEDWLFEIETAKGEEIATRLLELYENRTATADKVTHARSLVAQHGRTMMNTLRDNIQVGIVGR